jgi:peptide/nickel transport system substrate-binding protein
MRRLSIRWVAGAVVLALGAGLLAGCGGGSAAAGSQAGVLTIGMTAGDVPNLDTVLAGGQGYEGTRFVGFQLYDGLTRYDLKQGDHTPAVVPALATKWTVDPTVTTWTFTLRDGVTFHDGTPFDADAVIFNLDRYLNKNSPAYYPALAAQASLGLAGVKSYAKVDAHTVTIVTNGPWAHLPDDLTTVFMASPTAVRKEGNEGFAKAPVGTGPFKFVSLTRGQQAVFAANPAYWGGAPKLKQLVLKPIPDPAARVAALRSGEVNWIEAPNPDDIASLKGSGYQIVTNSYDHVWPWLFDESKKPLSDIRVRQALNFAIDRDTMAKDLLQGTADPAYQLAPRASLAYQKSNDVFSYDPAKAKRLLTEAGYPSGFSMTVSYPTSGSGNMQPGPMNEELRSDLAKVGVQVTLKPIEWATLLTEFASGRMPDGADAVNISLTFIQESFWGLMFTSKSPLNASHFADPQVDALIGKALTQTDPTARYATYAQAVALIDAQAPWLVVVNDRNPRALAASVHGFTEPKSWFVDLTTVSVD